MVERITERKTEPEPAELIHFEIRRIEREAIERKIHGKVVIKGREVPWEQNNQGLLQYLLWERIWGEVGTPGWKLFVQNIKKHSGRHTHQGGLAIFVLEGKGYSVVDGVRYDWEDGDLIVLPVKRDGCEHQHFNLDPNASSYWLAFIYMPMWDQVQVKYVQNAEHPDWVKVQKR
ncbi:MAG: cupin domain-containing protein [Chloroflexi bacterium]|nr:cupin domain-containing protein [Chloroflexota bacterium]